MHEVNARLLAIPDDVDPGILLELHGQNGCVELRLFQGGAAHLPGRPEALGLGQPVRLGQAAGDRCFKHDILP